MRYLEIKASFGINAPVEVERDLSSTLRGVWGRALRGIHCRQKQLECAECGFSNCAYFVLFEKKYSLAEQYHPYIIQSRFTDTGKIEARFKFFGWPCEHSGSLLNSVISVGGRQISLLGKRYILELVEIRDAADNILFKPESTTVRRPSVRELEYSPQACPGLVLTFITPLRQKQRGRLMNDFEWEPFAKSLIQRVRFIDQHFNREELKIADNIDISLASPPVCRTRWSEKLRVSFRQDSRMSIGGLLGRVKLMGVSPEMVGVLKLGRWLHAGKQCTFGNGEINLQKICQAGESE